MLNKIVAALALTGLTILSPMSSAHEIFKFDQVKWQPAGLDGAQMAVLWGSEEMGTAVWAFRLQPGVAIPAHSHSKDYWGFAVQGRWAHTDRDGRTVITAQDAFVRIAGNELHADRCMGPEVCINIIQFTGQRDIFFPPAPKAAQ